MRPRFVRLLALFLAAWLCTQSQASENSLITAEDIATQAAIGDPWSLTWNDHSARVTTPSPDGKQIAVVLRRGNLQQGTNEATLLVYDTAQLMNQPRPKTVAYFATGTRYQPLAFVRWLPDGKSLVFAATQGDDSPQVYRADLKSGAVTVLTNQSRGLAWFDITPSADYLVTLREPEPNPLATRPECQHAGCRITENSFYTLLGDTARSSYPLTRHELRSGKFTTVASATQTDPDLLYCRNDLKGGISPDGRFGLQECFFHRHQWPQWWSDYTVHPQMQKFLRGGRDTYTRQLVLVDFEQKTSRRLTRAPYPAQLLRDDTMPLWVDGGRKLLLTGALEPLEGVSEQERKLRAERSVTLLIDPITLAAERIADKDGAALRARAAAIRSSSRTHGLQLVLREALNEPPKLFAVSSDATREQLILDPNPWLAQRHLARTEVIEWSSKDGRNWRGGLSYPPNYRAGKRYPVLLQTHGFAHEKFSLSGVTRNFPGQALAAHAVLIVQIAENTAGLKGPEQWSALQAGYEAVIDHLDQLALIDRQKVGMVGWSWTGPAVGYLLTHSSYPIAAAAFTETGDFGWWYYLVEEARNGESQYGTPPFGAGLEVWRQLSPSFNLDQLHTPMMMWSGGFPLLWDWHILLRQLDKPVEYWSLPDGQHEVFKVAERVHTTQRLVDWFRFWLKDEQDSDADKAEQYARWREMRERQSARLLLN